MKKQLQEARDDKSKKDYVFGVAEKERLKERNDHAKKKKQQQENYAKDDLIKVPFCGVDCYYHLI